MGKTKKSKKQTKRTTKQPHSPAQLPQSKEPTIAQSNESTTLSTNEPIKDPTRKASMVILCEIDDQIRIMVPFGKRRQRRVMEARFVVAAPVTTPEETIDDIDAHVQHHNLHTGPVF